MASVHLCTDDARRPQRSHRQSGLTIHRVDGPRWSTMSMSTIRSERWPRRHGVLLEPTDRRALERAGWRTTLDYRENHLRARDGQLLEVVPDVDGRGRALRRPRDRGVGRRRDGRGGVGQATRRDRGGPRRSLASVLARAPAAQLTAPDRPGFGLLVRIRVARATAIRTETRRGRAVTARPLARATAPWRRSPRRHSSSRRDRTNASGGRRRTGRRRRMQHPAVGR